ncbi:hypothetical protein NVH58_004394, partial [Salmonella enterica]|nr:hypothetical protein [Salmonella enterica]
MSNNGNIFFLDELRVCLDLTKGQLALALRLSEMDDDLSFLSDDDPVIAGYLDNVTKRLPSYEKKLEGCQQVLINREFLASYKLASEFEDEIDRYLI